VDAVNREEREIPGKVSTSEVYSTLCNALAAYLSERLSVEIRFTPLPSLIGFLVASHKPGVKHGLVVSACASDYEKVYLYVHMAAHILLGHLDRPFATILEPSRGEVELAAWEVEQDRQADALASVMFWGCDRSGWETVWESAAGETRCAGKWIALGRARHISRLLPGERYKAIRTALRLGLTRKSIMLGLKLVRAAYHAIGLKNALANEHLRRAVRGPVEIYCITEMVSYNPALVQT